MATVKPAVKKARNRASSVKINTEYVLGPSLFTVTVDDRFRALGLPKIPLQDIIPQDHFGLRRMNCPSIIFHTLLNVGQLSQTYRV